MGDASEQDGAHSARLSPTPSPPLTCQIPNAQAWTRSPTRWDRAGWETASYSVDRVALGPMLPR
eukprot:1434371-Alexandrium_andersonii.AAC.1